MTTERTTEWISAGDYAIAVEVDARVLPDRPGEFFLTPDSVRRLEKVRKDAEAGDVEALKAAGKVYQRLAAN